MQIERTSDICEKYLWYIGNYELFCYADSTCKELKCNTTVCGALVVMDDKFYVVDDHKNKHCVYAVCGAGYYTVINNVKRTRLPIEKRDFFNAVVDACRRLCVSNAKLKDSLQDVSQAKACLTEVLNKPYTKELTTGSTKNLCKKYVLADVRSICRDLSCYLQRFVVDEKSIVNVQLDNDDIFENVLVGTRMYMANISVCFVCTDKSAVSALSFIQRKELNNGKIVYGFKSTASQEYLDYLLALRHKIQFELLNTEFSSVVDKLIFDGDKLCYFANIMCRFKVLEDSEKLSQYVHKYYK